MERYIAPAIKSASTLTDEVLWESIMMGDEASFALFVKKYSKTLFNYGHRLCDNRDFLKDCIQDLFVELWNRRCKIVATNHLKWYLFKSLRHTIFREQQKWSRNQPLNDEYDFIVEFDIEHHQIIDDEEKALTQKVKKTLEYLPHRQKEIIYLRYFEGLPFDDIAQIMDISKQSVHNLLQKSYKNFRKKWCVSENYTLATSSYVILLSLIFNNL